MHDELKQKIVAASWLLDPPLGQFLFGSFTPDTAPFKTKEIYATARYLTL